MSIEDDLVIAGVGAIAALAGALIGAWATRRAAVDAFERQGRREDEAWRRALHNECSLNLNLDKERAPSEDWPFETQVLRECSGHAAAFSQGVLQRIIGARTANEMLDAELDRLRPRRAQPGLTGVEQGAVSEMRRKVIGELRAIEVELRASVSSA